MGDANTARWWQTVPLVQLVLARVKEFYREPAALFWVYGFPLLLAFVLSLAFTSRPVEKITVDLVTDAGPVDALAARLAADPRLDVVRSTAADARNRLRTAKTGLVIAPAAGPAGCEYVVDPNQPGSVLAQAAVDNVLLRASTSVAAPTATPLAEVGGRYIDFLLPGLIGGNIMGGGLWGVGFVTVDMRVRKLLKRFLATPMRQRDFLLSLMLSRLLFLAVEMTIFLVFGYLVFGMTIRGDVLALVALMAVGAAAFAGIGLLVASRAQKMRR